MSNIIKPTISELNKCLSNLVQWQQFALFLPGINQAHINIIKQDNRDAVIEQKTALYDKWLQIYPNASWNDVISALEAAEENTIAEELRKRYHAKTEQKSFEVASASSSPSQNATPKEVIVREEIVTELNTFHQSFLGLAHDVKTEVKTKVENGDIDIDSVTHHLQEERAFSIPSLQSVTTSRELFIAIHPHYNFLNYYLIVSIAIHCLSDAIATKATEYDQEVERFMKTTKIRSLQSALKGYSKIFREHSNTVVVEIVVENGWKAQNLWLVRTLIATLFPINYPDELPWYNIVPGSVVMTFIALEHMTSSLIESSIKKTEFMRLVGVISLKIGGELVWEKVGGENKTPFYFEDSLIQTTLANNIETVEFLLRYTQVNINTKNTTNTLINADDHAEIYYNQGKVNLEKCHTMFTILLKDVEYELQNVQGKMEAIADDSNSTSPVADDDSRSAHHPRDNFLNGRVLADLADQLPDHLSTRVKQYQATIDDITKRKSLLIYLSSSLKKYFPTPFPDSIEVILTLHSMWRACSVWYVEQLGQSIFTPTLFHKLQWFRVDTSEESPRVVLLADKQLMDSLTKELGNNESLTSLFGVISAQVHDTVVISNDYSKGYTFGKAIELAETMENDKISDLLLQIQQSPVDFIRILRASDKNNNHRFIPEPDSTPLMIACCNDNSQLVQLLLDHNADPNILSRNSYTPLMSSTGNSKIFQMLLDHGADIKIRSFLNGTVLHYACRAGNVKVVRIILETNSDLVHIATNHGHTPLLDACTNGTTAIVQMLLQTKVDPNIQDSEGWTALKAASRYGHIKIVQMLLQAKATPDIQDNKGQTALHEASRYGHIEIVRILLQSKADPSLVSHDGLTALHLALEHGHSDIVKELSSMLFD